MLLFARLQTSSAQVLFIACSVGGARFGGGTIDSKHANSHRMWRMWRCSAAANPWTSPTSTVIHRKGEFTFTAHSSCVICYFGIEIDYDYLCESIGCVSYPWTSPSCHGQLHNLLRGTYSQDTEVAHALTVAHCCVQLIFHDYLSMLSAPQRTGTPLIKFVLHYFLWIP